MVQLAGDSFGGVGGKIQVAFASGVTGATGSSEQSHATLGVARGAGGFADRAGTEMSLLDEGVGARSYRVEAVP